MAEIGKMSRVVYLEDELDSGGDDFDLGFLGDESVTMKIPGFFSTNCNEAALANTYTETEDMTNRLCTRDTSGLCAQAPRCDADLVDDVARGAWPPPSFEPYALARPPSEIEKKMPHGRRPSKERFNYAKALLRSDVELERLARKIRSEIHQSEMRELAAEAERAADAGLESFSGRPSTFWDDNISTKPNDASLNLSRLGLKRHRTFSEGVATARSQFTENQKMKVKELRDVGEVIPKWRQLHLHLRTHLHRRKIAERTLVFNEESDAEASHDQTRQNFDLEETGSDIGKQSVNFFENIADLTMARLTTHGMVEGSGACGEALIEDIDDDRSQGSASSGSGRFGTRLSSHLSPGSGKKLRRPILACLPGLSHPDENDKSIDCNHYAPQEIPAASPIRPGLSTRKENETIATDPSATSALFFLASPKNPGVGDDTNLPSRLPFRLRSRERKESVALFDEDGDEWSSCPPSPSQSRSYALHTALTAESEPLTPRVETSTKKKDSEYATPARLRKIRGRKSNRTYASGKEFDERNLNTPEAMKIAVSPSSIIDDRQTISALQEDQALFLALPLIQNVSAAPYISRRITLAHKGVIRYPHCRPPHLEKKPNNSVGSSKTKANSVFVGKDSGVADVGVPSQHSVKSQDKALPMGTADIKQDEHRQDDLSESMQGGGGGGDDDNGGGEEYPPYASENSRRGLAGLPSCETSSMTRNNSRGPTGGHKNCEQFQKLQAKVKSIQYQDAKEGTLCLGVANANDTAEMPQHPIALHEIYPKNVIETQYVMRCNCECLVDDRSSLSDLGDPKSSLQSSTWGEGFPTGTPAIRRAFSWPTLTGLNDQATKDRHVLLDLLKPVSQVANEGDNVVVDSLAPARDHDVVTSSENALRRFPSTDESLQAAVKGMIASLSPSASKNQVKDMHPSDSDNNEFLKNYFYCVKGEETKSLSEEIRTQQTVCIEPCSGNEAFCHNFGVDTVCSGFTFFFTSGRNAPVVSSPPTARARSLSLDRGREGESTRWVDMFSMSSTRFTFRFKDVPENPDTSSHFQPPSLKTPCKSNQRK